MEKVKLPAQFRKDWLEALRSRKYLKGRSRLLTNLNSFDGRYCCLGVACRVLGFTDADIRDYSMPTSMSVEGIFNPEKNVPQFLLFNEGHYNGQPSVRELAVALAGVNDNNDSFEPVIEAIEKWTEADEDSSN